MKLKQVSLLRCFTLFSRLIASLLILLSSNRALGSAPDTLWTRFLGPGICHDVAELPNGGYIATGYSADDSLSGEQTRLTRLDSVGQVVWDKLYLGLASYSTGFGRRVWQNPDGGFLVLATENRAFSRAHRLFRTDANGEVIWTQVYDDGGGGLYYIKDALRLPDGSIVVLSGVSSVVLTKYTANGLQVWEQEHSDDSGSSLDFAPTGGFIVSGPYGYMLRTDQYGNELWHRNHSQSHDNAFESVKSISTGGFIAVGRSAGTNSLWLVKTDSNGDTLWTRSSNDYVGHDIELLQDGFVLISTGPKPSRDLGLIKYDYEGNRLWQNYVGTTQLDEGLELSPAGDGGWVVGGYGKLVGCNFETCDLHDFWIVRFAPPTTSGIPSTIETSPNVFELYPNPAATSTELVFFVKSQADLQVGLFDLQGRRLLTESIGVRESGMNRFPLTLPRLTAGSYWVRLSGTDGSVNTRRLVVTR